MIARIFFGQIGLNFARVLDKRVLVSESLVSKDYCVLECKRGLPMFALATKEFCLQSRLKSTSSNEEVQGPANPASI